MLYLKGVRKPVRKLMFVPDQPEVIAILEDSRWVFHWNIFLPTQVNFLKGSRFNLSDFDISPDKATVCAINTESELLTWNLATQDPCQICPRQYPFPSQQFPQTIDTIPQNLPITIGDEKFVTTDTTVLISTTAHHWSTESGVVYHHGSALKECLTGKLLAQVRYLPEQLWGRFLCGSPARLVQLGESGTLYRWDERHDDLESIQLHIRQMAMCSDRTTLALATADSLLLWNATDPLMPSVPDFFLHPAVQNMTDMCFTPEGDRLGIADDTGCVSLLDTATYEVLHVWDWGIGPVNSLAVSSDGELAAAGGADSIVVWDVE